MFFLEFYKLTLNKTTNLNEEYFIRKLNKPILKPLERFTSVLSIKEENLENKEENSENILLIITKKGKIKH